MPDDKVPTPDPTAGRHRHAPTIDLKATEVGIASAAAKEPHAQSEDNEMTPGSTKESSPGRTRSLWPSWTAIGGAVAGGALVMAGVWLGDYVFKPQPSLDLSDQLTRLEKQLNDVTARPSQAPDGTLGDDIAARLSAIERALAERATPSAGASDAVLAERLIAAEATVKTLTESLSALNRRAEDNTALARDARNRADAAVSRVETAQSDAAKRESETGGDHAVRYAIAALVLQGAVGRGEPFVAEFAAAKALAGDSTALASLESFAATGVPSTATLARELSALLPALVLGSEETPAQGGIIERLQSSAQRLVRIRPIDETPGDDPKAIIARIEIRAAHADIAGALAELTRLPEALRNPVEPWIEKVGARTAALAASREVTAEAIAALAKRSP
ncbi:MAG: hypothetical protein HY659_01930 [Rhizobiales bacterium]|nr:hypothetical protein [Hyphomicrobiales bacterium]